MKEMDSTVQVMYGINMCCTSNRKALFPAVYCSWSVSTQNSSV